MITYDRIPKNLWLIVSANFFLIILLAGFSILVMSCNESSVIGLNVKPANSLLNVSYTDTTTLITRTVRQDSLRTDGSLILSQEVLLGKYVDPIFGTATASIYTQLLLNPGYYLGFGSNPIVDSVVLALVYDTAVHYGNPIFAKQKVNVHELLQNLVTGNVYYSNSSFTTSPIDLANNYVFTPYIYDSVYIYRGDVIGGVTLKPQLRIPLSKFFGQTILDNAYTGNLGSAAAFESFIPGLYITTENTTGLSNTEGNIFRFNMGDVESNLAIYFHNDTTRFSEFDLQLYDIARFIHFNHNYSSVDANLASQLSNNPPVQNNEVFLQSMAGTQVYIQLPYLLNGFKPNSIVINKAELVVKMDTTTATYQLGMFSAPAELYLNGTNVYAFNYTVPPSNSNLTPGSVYALPDVYEGSAYFGGYYNSFAKEYVFDISRYIEQILNGHIVNNGLYLSVVGGGLSPNRVVVGGGGKGSAYQMKLNITYTNLR